MLTRQEAAMAAEKMLDAAGQIAAKHQRAANGESVWFERTTSAERPSDNPERLMHLANLYAAIGTGYANLARALPVVR